MSSGNRKNGRETTRHVRRVAASPAAAGYRPAGIALAVAAVFIELPALAQPSGAQAIHGSASLNQQGNKLTVTTQNGAGTNHSAINWQSFSVPGGTTTHFAQPNAGSTSINRVVGNDPSSILGTLSSNGRLVLVNPAGIAVGAGAAVNTAGFTASTLKMSDADAIAGRQRFGDGTPGGALSVAGQVVATQGDVVLIAPQVETAANAVIRSPNGATILAAGQKVEVTGRGLEGIRFEVQAPGDRAVNLGNLSGDAVGIFAGTLKHSGQIQATQVSTVGGKAVLRAAGDALVDGTITAAAAGGKGGSIDVFGNRVGLLAGARLDASGASGGGFIRVGGDFQGKNPDVPNAQRTYVDRDATLQADATGNGDGGRIIVWADVQTQSHGAISARGGAEGGDGGFVEVSGKQRLDFSSQVDTRAPKGKIGTLLLDPDSIDVAASGTPYTAPVMFADGPATLTLDVDTINAAMSDVILQANQDITIGADVNIAEAGVGFEARAGRFLTVFNPITTNGGDITLVGGDTGATPLTGESLLQIGANISSNGGSIFLQSRLSDVGGNSLYLDDAIVNAGAGAIEMRGQNIDIVGTSSVMRTGAGDLTLVSDRVDLQGTLVSNGGRVVFRTEDAAHPITLGGTDENAALNLTNAELNRVTASTIVVGWNNQTGPISIAGPVNVTNAPALSLIASSTAGAITQMAALTVASLNADAGLVTLNNAGNQITQLSGRGYAGGFNVRSANALQVGTVDGIAGIAGGAGAVEVDAAGLLTLSEGVSGSGAVTLRGNGVGMDPGKTVSGANVTFDGKTLGNLDLGLGTVTTGGTLTLTGATGGTLGNASAGTLTINGMNGTLLQAGGASINVGTLNGASNTGDLLLTAAGNQVTTLGALSTAGVLKVNDSSGNLDVTGPVSGSDVTLVTAGNFNQNAAVSSTATGKSLTISAAHYHNSVGAGALATPGEWSVYTNDVAGNTYGGLNSGQAAHYGASLASDPPASLGTGNHYVFADTPTATITANGATKVYDGTAGFGTLTYTVTGLVDAAAYGNVFTQDTVTGALDIPSITRNVGTYGIGQGTTTVDNNYSVNFVSGDFTVTAAPLVLSTTDVNRVYDGSTFASGSLVVTGGVLFSGDTVGGGSFDFVDKHVGSGKTVTVSGAIVGDGNGGSNYSITYADNTNSSITPKALVISAGDVTKVYDGTTTAPGVAEIKSGHLMGSDTLAGGTYTYADRHVGTGKTVSVSGVVISDGNGGNNYTVSYVDGNKGSITVRPQSTWTGSGGDGLWSNPNNWDALPDASNVQAVSIPSGAAVTYDVAVPTALKKITSSGIVTIPGGSLDVSELFDTAGYVQSGGVLTGTGGLTVRSSFSQGAGSILLTGPVSITQASGNLDLGAISGAASLHLVASDGDIRQHAALGTGGLLHAEAKSGVALGNSGNQAAAFKAVTSGTGDIVYVNSGDLEVVGAQAANGNISITATNLLLSGDVVASAGSLTLLAAHDLTQKGLAKAATGVTGTAGNSVTFGPNAKAGSADGRVRYTANGVEVPYPGMVTSTGDPRVDAIVQATGANAADASAAVSQSDGQARGADELVAQAEGEDKDVGKDAVNVTDTACTP